MRSFDLDKFEEQIHEAWDEYPEDKLDDLLGMKTPCACRDSQGWPMAAAIAQVAAPHGGREAGALNSSKRGCTPEILVEFPAIPRPSIPRILKYNRYAFSVLEWR